MLSKENQNFIHKSLKNSELITGKIVNIKTVYGGSVNSTYAIFTEKEKCFVKINSRSAFPEMFKKEAAGLELLNNYSKIKTPKVLKIAEFEDTAFLFLELIENGVKRKDYWESFGRNMAKLHRNTNVNYGLEYNNYNGSLNQENTNNKDWISFFIEKRLKIQEKLGVDNNIIDKELRNQLSKFYIKLPELLIEEKPALLHGDFWSGNFMVSSEGSPVIMDPAIYYGNREVDIAMSMLFGGFDKQFYKSYQKEFPLEKDWEKRVEIYNLYPLLVHVNLFGASYTQRVKSILKRLV